MATAQKLVTMFVLCMVVMSAMNDVVPKAEATSLFYKECFETCQNTCMEGGRGYTDCEMKCDTDCTKKEYNAKLNIVDKP